MQQPTPKSFVINDLNRQIEQTDAVIEYFDYMLKHSAKIKAVLVEFENSQFDFKLTFTENEAIRKNFTQFIADSLLDIGRHRNGLLEKLAMLLPPAASDLNLPEDPQLN